MNTIQKSTYQSSSSLPPYMKPEISSKGFNQSLLFNQEKMKKTDDGLYYKVTSIMETNIVMPESQKQELLSLMKDAKKRKSLSSYKDVFGHAQPGI